MLNPAGPPTWLHDPSRGSAGKHSSHPGSFYLWLLSAIGIVAAWWFRISKLELRRGLSHPHVDVGRRVDHCVLLSGGRVVSSGAPADVLTEANVGVGGYPDAWALTIQHAAVYRTSVPCTKGSKAGRTASMTWARVRSSSP
jgi:hypothetical protein